MLHSRFQSSKTAKFSVIDRVGVSSQPPVAVPATSAAASPLSTAVSTSAGSVANPSTLVGDVVSAVNVASAGAGRSGGSGAAGAGKPGPSAAEAAAAAAEWEANWITSSLSPEERFAIARTVGEECIQDEELLALFTKKAHPIVYDGFEPSGRVHIAQGLMRVMNVNKLTSVGCVFKFWVADWFAVLNNKMGGDLRKIQTVGRYMIEVWKAAGMDMRNVQFLWASEVINRDSDEYWRRVIDVARMFNCARIQRCCTIMGRKDGDELSSAQMMYPSMQCADVFHLKADICQLGMDQRKVNMLAREYCDETNPKIKFKPVILSHHMLLGLKEGQEKASKSDPDSAIFMEDSEMEVNRKVKRAFCPPGVVAGNPVLDYLKHIVFPAERSVLVSRSEENGGNVEFCSYEELEAAFLAGALHPGDAKAALATAINRLIEPVRRHFASGEPKKLFDQANGADSLTLCSTPACTGQSISMAPEGCGVNDAKSLWGAALDAYAKDDIISAKIYIDKLLIIKNTHARGLQMSAMICHRQGDLINANILISSAIMLHPTLADLYYSKSIICPEKANCIAGLKKAVTLEPHNVKCWLQLARLASHETGTEAELETRRAYEGAISASSGSCVEAHYRLGLLLNRLGEGRNAISSLSRALELDPSHTRAAYWLAAFRKDGSQLRAPAEYVRKLFDGYAATFDTHLVEGLEYRTPHLLRDALLRAVGCIDPAILLAVHREAVRLENGDKAGGFEPAQLAQLGGAVPGPHLFQVELPLTVVRWRRCADLGCGTGLGGAAVLPLVSDWLGGVDLSPRMVEKAAERRIYSRLLVGELVDLLECHAWTSGGPGGNAAAGGVVTAVPASESAPCGEAALLLDLVIAADVLPYLGDLTALMATLRLSVQPGGIVAFSTETRTPPPAAGAAADATMTAIVAAAGARGIDSPDEDDVGGGTGYVLRETGRYTHGRAYLARVAAGAGFRVLRQEAAVLRKNGGKDVNGLLTIFERTADATSNAEFQSESSDPVN